MSDEPTQTTPEGEERDALNLPGKGGRVIPVPSRGAVVDALKKLANAPDAAYQEETREGAD